MRKCILLFVVLISFNQILDAQWYYRSCGVTDLNTCTPEEFDCMWNKATSIVNIGSITTGAGFICYGIAAVIVLSSLDNFTDTHLVSTMLFGYAALSLAAVGIPVMITGVVRKAGLRRIPNWMHLNYSGISPSIGINHVKNSINYGMTLSFTF